MSTLSRKITIAITILAAFLLVIGLQAFADDGSASSYTELSSSHQGELGWNKDVELQPTGGNITVYTDRVAFDAATFAQMDEDFATSRVAANNVCADTGPWNALTDDACYGPGDLMEGFDLSWIGANSMNNVILTTGFLGMPCDAVGPNSFADDFEFSITDPAIYGVGFVNVVPPGNVTNVNIDVYGASGLIGSSSSAGDGTGIFWGAVADEPITRIVTNEPGGGGELFCNMVLARRAPTDVALTDFGGSSSSNLLPIAAVALIAVVGLGVVALRRKEA